jgi:sugar phosphate permease
MYDRFGARAVGTSAAIGLSGVLFLLSVSDRVTSALLDALPFLSPTLAAFAIVTPAFFLLRFFGQGVLTLASRNMVMEWFERRRGLANAIMGIAISFGFSYAPRIFQDLINQSDWHHAWRITAGVLAAFAVLVFLMFRDTPEAHGLIPDGRAVATKSTHHPETHAAREFTLPEARRTYSFWIFALSLAVTSLVFTAYTFNIVSIFKTAGMSSSQAVAIFFPASIVAVALQFGGSALSDYIRLKYLLMVQIAGIIVASGAILFFGPGMPVVLLIVGQGMAQGMVGIVSAITWPRFFGRQHLGAISGFVGALAVAGSAAGPYLFSVSLSATGSYAPASLLCLIAGVLLFAGSLKADRPMN